MAKDTYYDSTIEAPHATMDDYYADVSHRIIIDRIKEEGDSLKILDVGCGQGLLGSFLVEGNEVFGVDIHKSKIRNCLSKGIKAQLVKEDDPLPYEDNTFDVVTCRDVLEHLMDPFKMVSEINRVQKEGGIFLSTVPNMYDLWTRIAFPFGVWTKITFGANLGHIRFYSRKTYNKLIIDENFQIEKSISFSFTSYLPKLFGGLAYIVAIVANKGSRDNLKVSKQKIYQNINMGFTKTLGFTSLGGGLLVVARKAQKKRSFKGGGGNFTNYKHESFN